MKDPEIKKLIEAEKKRQKKVVNLIASENFVSAEVLAALGSELTNKYAEGYPGARYYGGNEVVDKIENICRTRALKLFKLSASKWHVNVQPLSGSPANLAVYAALVSPHGKIMGMSLDHGGHLTHGHKVSMTGKFWNQIPYGVDRATEMLNYDELKKIAAEHKPNIVVAGFTAYPRTIDFKKFRDIADAAGAYLLVDMSHIAGLVAGGVYPSPFPYADVVTTTTHKTLRGPRSAMIFVRKNSRVAKATTGDALVGAAPALDLPRLIDRAIFPGLQGGPHLNQIAAVATALREAADPSFKIYTKQVVKNAKALANELIRLNWRVISGGTDSHLVLVDTWMNGAGLPGKEASDRLERAGIIVNKNTIPFDSRSPVDPSGIRLGTAAETTLGKKEKNMLAIAVQIDKVLRKKKINSGGKNQK